MEPQTPPPVYQPTPAPMSPPVQPSAPIMPPPVVPPASSKRAVLMMLGAVILLGAGVFAWSQFAPSTPIAEESSSPSPSVSVDPTDDWKTYTNTQHGFEVKYPSDWSYKAISTTALSTVQFTKEPKDQFDEFPDQVSVSVYDSSKMQSVEQRGGFVNIKTSTFAGFPAKTYDNQPHESQGRQDKSFIEFVRDGQSFVISYQRDADMVIIGQILSTFKFIEAETAQEAKVRVAIEKVLNQQAIQNIRLLSLGIRGGAITMNFSKEIAAQGQAAFEQIFILVSNAINPFVQGAEVTYEVYIDGVGVGEVFK